MIIKSVNHEKMIRAISAQYGVTYWMTQGGTMNNFSLRNEFTKETVNIVIDNDTTFYHAIVMLWRKRAKDIVRINGRDFGQALGTMVAWLQTIYSYDEPLYFTVELKI